MIRAVVAIPGQPSWPAPQPATALADARAAIERIAATIADDELFGFLASPALAVREAGREELWLDCDSSVRNQPQSPTLTITWRWQRLWDVGDWYEVGWHPDSNYLALKPEWQERIWDALNPGKRWTA